MNLQCFEKQILTINFQLQSFHFVKEIQLKFTTKRRSLQNLKQQKHSVFESVAIRFFCCRVPIVPQKKVGKTHGTHEFFFAQMFGRRKNEGLTTQSETTYRCRRDCMFLVTFVRQNRRVLFLLWLFVGFLDPHHGRCQGPGYQFDEFGGEFRILDNASFWVMQV